MNYHSQLFPHFQYFEQFKNFPSLRLFNYKWHDYCLWDCFPPPQKQQRTKNKTKKSPNKTDMVFLEVEKI
jgi:hypothetical protein